MKWLVAVVAVEAVVEIILHSELFEWLRRLSKRTEFTAALFACGWCLSVWAGAVAVALVYFGLWWLMVPLAVSRASNFLHDAYGRLRG